MRLILFDIDGTLLSCGPQVRPIFASALLDVFGTAGNLDAYDFAGKTDPTIVVDLATSVGVAREDAIARIPDVRELYRERLAARLDSGRMTLLPGVVERLEELAADPQVELALLTGNWEPCARTKLAPFDLNRFFSFGAFGCDAIDRCDLPPFALDRAESHLGRRFAAADTLVVGDSIHDVACARAHGIPCLAVATGRTSAAELHAVGADRVVADLSEPLVFEIAATTVFA